MSQIVNEKFNQSLRSSTSAKRKKGTMFDELYGALETSDNPIDRVIQMIAEFHGVWTGGGQELFAFASFLASATQSRTLQNITNTVGGAAQSVLSLASQLPPSMCGRQNAEFAAIMPTPLLREFVGFVHNIHPAVNMYLQMHQGSFPYFQQISEEVGRFAQIAMRASEISPMDWPKMGGVNCLNTNTRMDKNTLLKMMPSIFSQMDNASNLLNSLFLRGMRPENNISLLEPDYGKTTTSAPDDLKKKNADFQKRSGDALKESESLTNSPNATPEQIAAMNVKLASLNVEGKELLALNKQAKKAIDNSKPKAHGHNFCMDVFGAKRRIDAIPGAAAIVMQKAGDALRLVNKFFPVRQVAKYETESFEISMNHGPNGEPITFITDNRGRRISNGPNSDDIVDPTNDRKLTAKDEHRTETR